MADVISSPSTTFVVMDRQETEAMRELLRLGFIALCQREAEVKDHEEREELKVIAGNSFSLLYELKIHEEENT